jgi:hypothetical protein
MIFFDCLTSYCPLKKGSHQRGVDDCPAFAKHSASLENLANPACHHLCARMRILQSQAQPNFPVGRHLIRLLDAVIRVYDDVGNVIGSERTQGRVQEAMSEAGQILRRSDV